MTLEYVADRLNVSRPFLGEVERGECAASPRLQRQLGEFYALAAAVLFDQERCVDLRRREQLGEWVRQKVACEILEVTKQTLRCRLEPTGVIERRGGSSPFQYHRATLEELVPPGSLTLPEMAERQGLTMNQVWRYRRRGELKTFQPWPKANYRVLPEQAESFADRLRAERPGHTLAPEAIAEARRLRADGRSYNEIARTLRVSYPTARHYTKDIDPAKARPADVGAKIAATMGRKTAQWRAKVPRGGCGIAGCPDPGCPFDYGQCHCGCAERTSLPKQSLRSRNIVRGEPHRYLPGHHPQFGGMDSSERIREFTAEAARFHEAVEEQRAQGWLTRADLASELLISEREVGYYDDLGLLERREVREGGRVAYLYPLDAVRKFERAWALGLDNGRRATPLDPNVHVARLASRGLIERFAERRALTVDEAKAVLIDRAKRRAAKIRHRRRGRKPGQAPPAYHTEWRAAFKELEREHREQHDRYHVEGDQPPTKMEIALLVAEIDAEKHPERWSYDPRDHHKEAARRVLNAVKRLQNPVTRIPAA
jgi:hypothetical protein